MPGVVELPINTNLRTIGHFARINEFFPSVSPIEWLLKMRHDNAYLHPVALTMLAAWGRSQVEKGRGIFYEGPISQGIQYASRMGLFDELEVGLGKEIEAHEPTGRFIPLTRINDTDEVERFVTDLPPLYHGNRTAGKVVSYCMSEMLRNATEHAAADGGIYAAAQFYPSDGRVSIGVVDCGQGIRATISRRYDVSGDMHALLTALRAGTSGAIAGAYGQTENMGAGLFFLRNIAKLSGEYFCLYSGGACYRSHKKNNSSVTTDPQDDRFNPITDINDWQGTVVGIDINVPEIHRLGNLFRKIRNSMPRGTKVRREYSEGIRFV